MMCDRLLRWGLCGILVAISVGASGCASLVRWAAESGQTGDPANGITYYIGGAGPIGHVGSIDVPNGLLEAGYTGFVEVYTWQGVSHTRDQIDLIKNKGAGAELASRFRTYMMKHPKQSINIIALSAGTGIATFALEYLPERHKVDNVVYLGCSMSAGYDLTRALKRVRGGMYVVHSPHDRMLSDLVWFVGTVDREAEGQDIAGLVGFRLPDRVQPVTLSNYARLRNVPYRSEFAEHGYDGGHMSCVSREFIREHVAAVVLGNRRGLLGDAAQLPSVPDARPVPPLTPSARPTTHPAAAVGRAGDEAIR